MSVNKLLTFINCYKVIHSHFDPVLYSQPKQVLMSFLDADGTFLPGVESAIGVFPKWSRTFAEFSEFRETDKSLKHEWRSIKRSKLSHMSCWHWCSMLVSYTRGAWVAGSSPFNVINFLSLNSLHCHCLLIKVFKISFYEIFG